MVDGINIPDLNPSAQRPQQPDSNEKRVPIPSLMDLLLDMKREALQDLNAAKIGQIVSFDPATQTAQVQILLKQYVENAPDITKQIIDYPLLVDCPVFFAGGGLGSLRFPVAAGDECLLVFCDRDIDLWFTTGQTGIPNSNRLHDISDGFAIVGFRSAAKALQDFQNDEVQLKHGDAVLTLKDGTKAEIKSGTSLVKVNQDGTVKILGAVTLLTAMQTLYSTIDGLISALIASQQTDDSVFNPATLAALAAVSIALAASLVTMETVIE